MTISPKIETTIYIVALAVIVAIMLATINRIEGRIDSATILAAGEHLQQGERQ